MRFQVDDLEYPAGLRELPDPPPTLTTSGPLVATRAVAIVGSREATYLSRRFARTLAFHLARCGVVVVSGGALGVDAAAHDGAMQGGGDTWVVAPTGRNHLYPPEHAALFRGIERSAHGRMIWPFPDDATTTPDRLRYRNGILVALSEAVVVVQAHLKSGSRNAARWARDLGRPVWVVPATPWMGGFSGSLLELRGGAQLLTSVAHFFAALDLPKPSATEGPVELPRVRSANRKPAGSGRPRPSNPKPLPDLPGPPPNGVWSDTEKAVFSEVSLGAKHIDKIAEKTGRPAGATANALLTLALKDVVVEGPDGFFRRKISD